MLLWLELLLLLLLLLGGALPLPRPGAGGLSGEDGAGGTQGERAGAGAGGVDGGGAAGRRTYHHPGHRAADLDLGIDRLHGLGGLGIAVAAATTVAAHWHEAQDEGRLQFPRGGRRLGGLPVGKDYLRHQSLDSLAGRAIIDNDASLHPLLRPVASSSHDVHDLGWGLLTVPGAGCSGGHLAR